MDNQSQGKQNQDSDQQHQKQGTKKIDIEKKIFDKQRHYFNDPEFYHDLIKLCQKDEELIENADRDVQNLFNINNEIDYDSKIDALPQSQKQSIEKLRMQQIINVEKNYYMIYEQMDRYFNNRRYISNDKTHDQNFKEIIQRLQLFQPQAGNDGELKQLQILKQFAYDIYRNNQDGIEFSMLVQQSYNPQVESIQRTYRRLESLIESRVKESLVKNLNIIMEHYSEGIQFNKDDIDLQGKIVRQFDSVGSDIYGYAFMNWFKLGQKVYFDVICVFLIQLIVIVVLIIRPSPPGSDDDDVTADYSGKVILLHFTKLVGMLALILVFSEKIKSGIKIIMYSIRFRMPTSKYDQLYGILIGSLSMFINFLICVSSYKSVVRMDNINDVVTDFVAYLVICELAQFIMMSLNYVEDDYANIEALEEEYHRKIGCQKSLKQQLDLDIKHDIYLKDKFNTPYTSKYEQKLKALQQQKEQQIQNRPYDYIQISYMHDDQEYDQMIRKIDEVKYKYMPQPQKEYINEQLDKIENEKLVEKLPFMQIYTDTQTDSLILQINWIFMYGLLVVFFVIYCIFLSGKSKFIKQMFE